MKPQFAVKQELINVEATASDYRNEANVTRLSVPHLFQYDLSPDDADILADRLKAASAEARKNKLIHSVEAHQQNIADDETRIRLKF
jgi:hypothetical protein